MKKALITLAIMAASSIASADVPAWVCAMNFNGVSKGIQVIVGHFEFKGKGTLSCTSASGQKAVYPVKISMDASPLAPEVGVGYMELYGEALSISLSHGTPTALIGNYSVEKASASLIGGAGVIRAVRLNNSGLTIALSLQLTKGLGVNLGFSKMKLALD